MKILFITFHKDDDQKKPDFYKFADYMCDLTLHGFRELYGTDVIDYPGSWQLYKDEALKRKLDKNIIFGKGFTYTNILNDFDKIDRSDIENKIKSNYFDLIVYGSIRRSNLFFDQAINSKSKIIFIDGHDDTLIDKNYIKHGVYFKRELQENIASVKSISFAVPKSKILKSVDNEPVYLIAPLIPGRSKTYIYDTEDEYYKMYQKSIFAITYKKTGWDCMRHYEILMNGCIPLFLDIESCPKKIMEDIPKQRLIEIKNRFQYIFNSENPFKIFIKKFQKKTIIIDYLKYKFGSKLNISNFLEKNADVFEIKNNLLNYTKEKLTTEVLAKKILKELN